MSSFVNAPVHDMLIRIKNAYMARKTNVNNVQYSKLKENVLKILKEHGFILDYNISEYNNKKFINIVLKEVTNPIQDIPVVKFYSKPARRYYVSYKDLHKVAGGLGIGVISTNKGLMTTKQARNEKVGGELLFEIY
jgi:small subunit ribosomal protein S8